MLKFVIMPASVLLVSALACVWHRAPELPISVTKAHCQTEDIKQAFGDGYRSGVMVMPHIQYPNPSGTLDTVATNWTSHSQVHKRPDIGCRTVIYDSVENAQGALKDPSVVLFLYAAIEPQPLELIEESPAIVPAIGHQSLAFRTDASRSNDGSNNGSSEGARDYVATTVMFRRETVVVTITVSANCFGSNRQLCDTVPGLLADGETVDGLISVARLIDGRIEEELVR